MSFNDRIVYYISKIFSDQLGDNDSYSKLHRCVSLCILNFSLFKDDRYFRKMLIRDDNGNIFSDKLEFDCLEIPKIRGVELTEGMDKKLQWAKFFAAASEEDLNMVKEKSNNPAIDQAVLTVKKLSSQEEMKLEALAREKAHRDMISLAQDSRAEGEENMKKKDY